MNTTTSELYLQVEDKHGAIANIYESAHEPHRVIYYDSNGIRFFREDFAETPIEFVEQAVIDWAVGKRSLENAA